MQVSAEISVRVRGLAAGDLLEFTDLRGVHRAADLLRFWKLGTVCGGSE